MGEGMSDMTDLRTTTDRTGRRRARPPMPNATGRDPGSRAARAVWITLGGILAIAALGWGTYSVISVLAHEEYTERSTFASDDVSALAGQQRERFGDDHRDARRHRSPSSPR